MTDHKATPEQWYELELVSHASSLGWAPCILELRNRIETLEDAAQKHIVETSANILALCSRVESLEAGERTASKVYQISKPLKLTPEQAQQVRDLLAPNSKPPSLKEQALEGLTRIESTNDFFSNQMRDLAIIRRALEALDD